MATRQGLQAQSFDLAAEAYEEAVGGAMAADSLRRITEGWGQQVETQRQAAAERAHAPAQKGEGPQAERISPVAPIAGPANISTDGCTAIVLTEPGRPLFR